MKAQFAMAYVREWHKNLLQELVLRVSCGLHIKCFNQLIVVLSKRGAWIKPEALKARRCNSGATKILPMAWAKTSDFSMLCLFICKMGTINARLWYIPQKVLWQRQSHITAMFFQYSSWIIKQQQAPAYHAHTFWKGTVPMSISAGVNVGRTLVFLFSFSWTIETRCLTGKPEAKIWDSCCQTSIRVNFWFFWYLLFRVFLFVYLKSDWASTPKLAVILENAHYGAAQLSGNTWRSSDSTDSDWLAEPDIFDHLDWFGERCAGGVNNSNFRLKEEVIWSRKNRSPEPKWRFFLTIEQCIRWIDSTLCFPNRSAWLGMGDRSHKQTCYTAPEI